MLKLKQLCKEADLSRRTIQGYEKEGLLTSKGRTDQGYLLYDDSAVETAKMIRLYQRLGFRLSEIKEIKDADKPQKLEILLEKEQELEHLVRQREQDILQLRAMIDALKEEE